MDTADKRRALKSAMPRTVLELVHTQACALLPSREVMLEQLPKSGVVAEIGVAFGDFTREILARNNPRFLYLVDAWSTPRYRDGLEGIRKEFAEEIDEERVKVCEGLSVDVLAGFDDAMFDWVYVDTNHTYKTTAQELELCREKVVPGGLIAGHDFCTGNVVDAVPYGVVEAVTEFCAKHHWRFRYLTVESWGHFSFCLEEIPGQG